MSCVLCADYSMLYLYTWVRVYRTVVFFMFPAIFTFTQNLMVTFHIVSTFQLCRASIQGRVGLFWMLPDLAQRQ